jgi:hypothetical protein
MSDPLSGLFWLGADYGIRERLEPQLNEDEKRRFLESAAAVQKTIRIGSADTAESHATAPKHLTQRR